MFDPAHFLKMAKDLGKGQQGTVKLKVFTCRTQASGGHISLK